MISESISLNKKNIYILKIRKSLLKIFIIRRSFRAFTNSFLKKKNLFKKKREKKKIVKNKIKIKTY